MYPFNHITEKDLGSLPAMVDIASGELFLNPAVMQKLPDYWQRYVLLHEAGHLINGTTDEAAAGQYAVNNYIDKTSNESRARTAGQLLKIIQKIQNIPEATRLKVEAQAKEFSKENPGKAAFWELIASMFSSSESNAGNVDYAGALTTYNLIIAGHNAQGMADELKDQDLIQRKKQIIIISLVILAFIAIALLIVYKTVKE